jgi:sulfur-carrier protein adenylyltransferase/sulfurtransferase
MPTELADEVRAKLTPDEIRRYSRHLTLPEVGVEGQERLKAARVLLVGAGGLGSPASLYLAAAGVGTLGLVEFDRVDETNLQRQILYGQADVGRPKLEAAVERLAEVNPHVRLEPYAERLAASNALALVSAYDLVIDGSDNFPTRYLVNDACVLAGKPYVYGSIFRFEGQVSVFWGARGPCYRCLFPEPPPAGLVPNCAEGGVLGVLPGIIGSLQANEAIKLVLGVGQSLLGRLVVFDALKLTFRELKLAKSPHCPVCGERPTLTELVDYAAVCETPPEESMETEIPRALGPAEVKGRLDQGEGWVLLDVRSPQEIAICRIEGSIHIPLQELPQRIGELDPGKTIVAYCHTGVRSARAQGFLERSGFPRVINLRGGIEAWSLEVDPSVPRY